MLKTLTLLILTGIVIASVACGPPPPAGVTVVTATPPPAPIIPSAQDLIQQQQTAHLLFHRAEAIMETGNNEKAIESYTQAIELWPSALMYMNRGVAYGRLGNVAQACKDSDSAMIRKDQLTQQNLQSLQENINTNCTARNIPHILEPQSGGNL
jgi:tetratricopeptide (TPR) repeat protein